MPTDTAAPVYADPKHNPLGSRKSLDSAAGRVDYFDLAALGDVSRLPFSIRILLEACLRNLDGYEVTEENVRHLLGWSPRVEPTEVPFKPARVILQDFTGVPCVVDLAAMRSAMDRAGGDPQKINPLIPVDLVIDHSVQVDEYANPLALFNNARIEFERNRERYEFLKWGQKAFRNFAVVPPSIGIVHQVNLEYLASVVMTGAGGVSFPDTLVGTDSHTTMINGLGVLGWGVGGIEAEAAMLGQPCFLLTPQVVGFKLTGQLPEGATATDLVLMVTQILRNHGVVGKFVEFFGPGMKTMSVADRATIANMAPEYGATMGFFPVDEKTLDYLRLTGRDEKQIDLVERYCKANHLWAAADAQPQFTETLELDLGSVVPSVAGPRRPQDRIELPGVRQVLRSVLMDDFGKRPEEGVPRLERWRGLGGGVAMDAPEVNETFGGPAEEVWSHQKPADEVEEASMESFPASDPPSDSPGEAAPPGPSQRSQRHAAAEAADHPRGGASSPSATAVADPASHKLRNGDLVIAAITSCTNTSNPSVMIAAGLVAKKANALGLKVPPIVKTSLAPGSRVVTDYLEKSSLQEELDKLGFHTVGYGCTTCIGNSGPLPEKIAAEIERDDLVVCSVLSGNRNFEGRINPHVKANFLASPPLVVAYALAGTMDVNIMEEPIGIGHGGREVYLRDIWPTLQEVTETMAAAIEPEMYRRRYSNVAEGNEEWNQIALKGGELFEWDEASTYVQEPPFFTDLSPEPAPVEPIRGARVLVMVGDSVTTDHISPAGSIRKDSPAGQYLIERGVPVSMFNSYGARRGNDRIMTRGTFANIRLKNQLARKPDGSIQEGGYTTFPPGGELGSVYDAAMRYRQQGTPLIVLAGKDYGMGSSRDWAAKGTNLLGVRAVIAESFERIHRSNLVGMGVLPLVFAEGQSAASLELDGTETFDVALPDDIRPQQAVRVTATRPDGQTVVFEATSRIDTPVEVDYYRHGGILQTVLRQLLKATE